MIVTEVIGKWIDGKTDLISRKSDDPGKQLNKVGTSEIYDEAVDLVTSNVSYVEVDKPIPPSDEGEQEGDEPSPTEVE